MSETSSKTPLEGVFFALAAAALFGASTPFAKIFTGQIPSVLLAGLLYLGSGLGLGLWWLIRRQFETENSEAGLKKQDIPWLSGAILSGGILGPVFLMLGLAHTPASTTSLLLNMEGVLTALLAWFVFKENFDTRIFIGMVSIILGSVLLSYQGGAQGGSPLYMFSIVGACLCWGIDNNLTRKVSGGDPVQIAGLKGFIAGIVNISIALLMGAGLPGPLPLISANVIGFLGYGVSLTLFVLALRHIGTARTGAYFSLAPFIGAIISILLLKEPVTPYFLIAAVLMGLGVWVHLTERHEHEHVHDPMEHEHRHFHDEHHQHEHSPDDPPGEPHSHRHRHESLIHSHPHYPDIHHRHRH